MADAATSLPEAGAFVSLRLVAKAAGISLNEMKRIAGQLAAGHQREWLGAAVVVRTVPQDGGRHRDIALASLPPVLVSELASDRLRFLVAAEQVEPGAELRPADFLLVHRAAQCPSIPADIFARIVANLAGDHGLARATRDRFDLVMDYVFGFGFRDPGLPEVAPDYLAWLEQARTMAGLDDAAFGALLAEAGQADSPERLTGAGFYIMVAHLHQRHGVRLYLPSRGVMSRFVVGQLHRAVYALNLPYRDHRDLVTVIGGGCLRTSGLDERGARRLQSHYYSRGFVSPELPPRVAGTPGFITQPQANLLWKLWLDYGTPQQDLSEAALAEWLQVRLGIEGGLHGLTTAGTRRVIDFMIAPLIELRLAALARLDDGLVAPV